MSTRQEIQQFIQITLRRLLDNMCNGFAENELAYLSAHGKNEMQIRDKIAWKLHNEITRKYGNQFVVRREWAPKGSGRNKVDLAVLELDSALTSVVNTIALIEFKAQSIARKEKWYIDEFKRDVEKMRRLAQSNTDLYFVFIENLQDRKADEYKSILGFAAYQTQNVSYYTEPDYLSAIESHWNEFQSAIDESIVIPEPKVICIGEAYGYKQYISPLLMGPLRR